MKDAICRILQSRTLTDPNFNFRENLKVNAPNIVTFSPFPQLVLLKKSIDVKIRKYKKHHETSKSFYFVTEYFFNISYLEKIGSSRKTHSMVAFPNQTGKRFARDHDLLSIDL